MREDDCTYQRTGEKVCLCTASTARLYQTKVGFPARPCTMQSSEKRWTSKLMLQEQLILGHIQTVVEKNLQLVEIPSLSSFHCGDTTSTLRKSNRLSNIQTRFFSQWEHVDRQIFYLTVKAWLHAWMVRQSEIDSFKIECSGHIYIADQETGNVFQHFVLQRNVQSLTTLDRSLRNKEAWKSILSMLDEWAAYRHFDKRQIANTIFTIATGEWEKNCGKVKCCICTSGCNLSCSLSEALSKKTTAENMVDELNNKIADSESERYLKDVWLFCI